MKNSLTLLTLIGATMCLTLSSCKNSQGLTTADGTETPPHDMAPEDYPFDAEGNYREDWVGGQKVVDLTENNSTTPFYDPSSTTSKPTTTTAKTTPKSTYTKPKPKVVSKPKPKPVSKPKPSYTYHKVAKGDTLYSISRKYGTSVPAIQSANGMGGRTTIVDGRSLKIPRK